MKTTMEDNIRQNLRAFDSELPPEGHLERFELRLRAAEQARKEVKTWRRPGVRAAWISVAALVAVVCLFRWGIPQGVRPVEDEVAQVGRYYDGQLREQAREVEALTVRLDPESRAAILREIRGIVDRAGINEPEYALMTPPEQINFLVRRYNTYSRTLGQIEEVLEGIPGNVPLQP